MIGEHVVTWEGGQEILKLGTRAMARIEEVTGKPFTEALQAIGNEKEFRITKIVEIIQPAMNAGKGADIDAAYELIDQIGVTDAAEAIGEAFNKAFPGATKAAAGNAQGRKGAKAKA